MDTPKAVQIVRTIERDPSLSAEMKAGYFLFADQVFGLDLNRKEVSRELPPGLEKIMNERAAVRVDKNWQESDRLREVLEGQGLIINDTSTGQEWQWR